jgi:HPt (histidine-containing phosphotransfer) domain-containing protein
MSPSASPNVDDHCDPQVLDLQAAVDRIGGDRQLLRELAEIFLEDSAVLLDDLKTALAGGNREQVERCAHSLRGIAANLGGTRVEAAAAAIEETARSGSLDIARLAVDPLTVEFNRLTDALRRTIRLPDR